MPTQQAGVGAIDIDEMVNFCMLAPLQAQPLAWGSEAVSYTHLTLPTIYSV